MPKLFSQNKKILFLIGFVLFLSLTIPHFTLAATNCNQDSCFSPCDVDCCLPISPFSCLKDCSKVTCEVLTPPCDLNKACCSPSSSDPTKCELDCNLFNCSDYSKFEPSCRNLSTCCEWKADTNTCASIISGATTAEKWCPGCGRMPHQWPYCIKCTFEYTASLPIRVAFFVLIIPIALIALFTGLLYSLMAAIFSWMIKISLEVGITPGNPMTPEVVNIGWNFTRDFVDMFFILILAYIGLATILKLKEYEAKKLLPKLIIIALLINFTPVIVGFIVDVGNIFTNFFLTRAADIVNLEDILKMVWEYFVVGSTDPAGVFHPGAFQEIFGMNGIFFEHFVKNVGDFIGMIIYGIAMIIFFLLGSWIYFLVWLAFLLRIVELWILMILCPIAFFSHIFPKGNVIEKLFPSILHWDKWWEEFLQWIIWGIPMGFFLYLSNWVMKNTSVINDKFNQALLQEKLQGATGFGAGLEAQLISFVVSILAPTVALVLLYKGYKIAKETAPAAAKGMIEGLAKAGQIAAALGITAVTMGAGAGATAGLLGKASAGAQRLEAFTGKAGWTTKGGKRIEPFRYLLGKPISTTTKGVEMALAPGLLRYAAKTRRVDWGARFKGMEPGEIAQIIDLMPTRQQRTTATAWMKGESLLDKPGVGEDFKDKRAIDAQSLIKDPHYKKSANDVFETLTRKVNETIALNFKAPEEKQELKDKISKIADEISRDVKIRPQIEAEVRDLPDKDKQVARDRIARDMAAREIWVGELKAGDVKNIEKKSLREDIGTRRGMKNWSSAHMSALVNNFKKEVVDDSLNKTGGLNAMFEGKTPEESRDILEKLNKENPRIVSFFATTPAGREWAWQGLNHMTDIGGRSTKSFGDFKERQDVFSRLEKLGLDKFVAGKNALQGRIDKAANRTTNLQIDLSKAMIAGDINKENKLKQDIAAEEGKIIRAQDQIKKIQTQIDRVVARLERDLQKAKELKEIRKIETDKNVKIIS